MCVLFQAVLTGSSRPTILRKNESYTSFHSAASQSGSDLEVGLTGTSVPGTPLRHSLTRHLSELDKREDEDLYVWMQRQQVGL